MLWKTRSQRFKSYFNEVNILSLIIAKCFVWCPIITIFSGGATGASCGLSGVSSDEATMVILWIEFPFVVNFDFFDDKGANKAVFISLARACMMSDALFTDAKPGWFVLDSCD
jgi:hypothetical protein